MPFSTAKCYVQWLCNAGYVAPAEQKLRNANNNSFDGGQFTLLKDSFHAPRITRSGRKVTQGTATLAMWRAMMALKEFTWHDVALAASLPGAALRPTVAKAYVNALSRAGYFRVVRPAKPGTPARLRLVNNTGAQAPAITSRKAVFDRNLGKFTWQQPEQEVCDGLE